MYQLKIELKRVQTFIFEVPRLKAMLGANALIGETMRHELRRLIKGRGRRLDWTAGDVPGGPVDPLAAAADRDDRDDPAALYADGILARDGGHFNAVFEDDEDARQFLNAVETTLAERLPGVLYDASIEPFPRPQTPVRPKIDPHETVVLDLPVLQVCQETGAGPASDQVPAPDQGEAVWQASSVTLRQKWGDRFYSGRTRDIIGLLRPALYPHSDWKKPDDVKDLAAGGYLALIHADGNAIGKRYNDWRDKASGLDDLGKEAHGEAFFHSMRVAVRRAVVDALASTFSKPTEPNTTRPYEVLMLGGDDLLLMCRADRALAFARNYAAELKNHPLADGRPLAVAIGVAIAQKTYPLHRLHELAEALASSAKRLYRALEGPDRASVIDWQVVTQSWFEGVAEARGQSECVVYRVGDRTETLLLSARPYRVLGDDGLEGLLDAVGGLDGSPKGQAERQGQAEARDKDEEKAARSPLRGLRGACERGRLWGEMVFARLPKGIQQRLVGPGGGLWQALGKEAESTFITRALDVIGIWEIARLGSKKP